MEERFISSWLHKHPNIIVMTILRWKIFFCHLQLGFEATALGIDTISYQSGPTLQAMFTCHQMNIIGNTRLHPNMIGMIILRLKVVLLSSSLGFWSYWTRDWHDLSLDMPENGPNLQDMFTSHQMNIIGNTRLKTIRNGKKSGLMTFIQHKS